MEENHQIICFRFQDNLVSFCINSFVSDVPLFAIPVKLAYNIANIRSILFLRS